jgi:hypothetical protein
LYLLWYVLESFVVDLQVIGDSPILSQAARLQATERNGSGKSDVYQISEESCEKADSVSRSARSIELSLVDNAIFGWCGFATKKKGLHRLGKYCCKADVNWQCDDKSV